MREHCQQLLQQTRAHRFWLGYSGGLDSTVLLHLLSQLEAISLRAIHVNHGLSPHAQQWVAHCQMVCQQLNVSLQVEQIDAQPPSGMSPEAIARERRYEVFRETIPVGDFLLTAHHQDDQAETLLLQLLRGAGPKGLAAMPVSSVRQGAGHLRPLLGYSRTQLVAYAQEHRLQWVDDESNANTAYDRNYIRHQVMPLLKQRWAKTSLTLSRAAENCAEAATLLDDLSEMDFQECGTDIIRLKQLSTPRLHNVLRHWVRLNHFPLPAKTHIDHIISDVISSQQDACPLVHWQGTDVRRFDNHLYIMAPLPPIDNTQAISWNLKEPIELPGKLGTLHPNQVNEVGEPVEIRFRQGGERLGSKPLKKILYERRIVPWLRGRTPLIYREGKLVQIIDLEKCP